MTSCDPPFNNNTNNSAALLKVGWSTESTWRVLSQWASSPGRAEWVWKSQSSELQTRLLKEAWVLLHGSQAPVREKGSPRTEEATCESLCPGRALVHSSSYTSTSVHPCLSLGSRSQPVPIPAKLAKPGFCYFSITSSDTCDQTLYFDHQIFNQF